MHIGIYINNENIANVNCSNLMFGNPGIGGTEYCVLLLAQAYKEFFAQDKVTLFVSEMGLLPAVDCIIRVKGLDELCETANESQVNLLVISAVHNGMPLPKKFFSKIEEKKIKTVLWGHNFYLNNFCNMISNCPYVKANVFVGRQQYDRYLDHKVIKKSTYIYNMYPQLEEEGRTSVTNHSVTYIGSLVTTKGFHVLAAAWKNVIKVVPDATLNVIGSGKLYGRNSKLGQYNIADEEYENQFMPGLIDAEGKILSSVHFLGVLGTEKDEIIRNTCVGVVNPTGRTETFGISALDFESRGVPVVTIAKGGFLDTIIDGETGLLYQQVGDLEKDIADLLIDKNRNEIYGAAGRELCKNFLPEKIIREWNALFCSIMNAQPMEYKKPESFMNTNLKRYRCINRSIKNKLRIEYPVSLIGVESFARNVLRWLGK